MPALPPPGTTRGEGARLMIKGTHPAVPERNIHALVSPFGVVGKIEVLEVMNPLLPCHSMCCFSRWWYDRSYKGNSLHRDKRSTWPQATLSPSASVRNSITGRQSKVSMFSSGGHVCSLIIIERFPGQPCVFLGKFRDSPDGSEAVTLIVLISGIAHHVPHKWPNPAQLEVKYYFGTDLSGMRTKDYCCAGLRTAASTLWREDGWTWLLQTTEHKYQ